MNSKNIKKSLNAKLKDWIASIEDEDVKKEISNNVIVTGGAIVSLLTNEPVHDYDVYFRNKESLVKVALYYICQWNTAGHTRSVELHCTDDDRVKCFVASAGMAEETDDYFPFDDNDTSVEETEYIREPEKPKYRPVYFTSNAITLSDKIQIVTRFYGDVEDIHKNYDYAHCTCAWSSWDNNLSLPQKALECIINKELFYTGSKYPLCSIIRSRKYIKRGYTINAGQYLKMCLQLNELDLKNIEVLKEQLIGVDSAYFDAALGFIEDKKKENPDFVPDNEYLFEVINRIF